MTDTRPAVNPEGFYSMTEAAKALKVDRHTLYRYEEQGLLKFRVRRAGRRKVISGRQIILLWEKCY